MECGLKLTYTHESDKVDIIHCSQPEYLSVSQVLTTFSIIKGQINLKTAFLNNIDRLECRMSPLVKKNMIKAGKKLKMYGKEIPVIAQFDEYGNLLPSEVKINDSRGADLVIVDFPDEPYFLEVKIFYEII